MLPAGNNKNLSFFNNNTEYSKTVYAFEHWVLWMMVR